MLCSVIIPTYNCASTLRKTVESVLRSGLEDFEIVLVDDGSADGTPELCDRLRADYSQIRCVYQENGGVSRARNRGIQEAVGEYVLFFDADDTVDAGAFEKIETILQLESPDMLMFGMSFDYYFKGKMYRRDLMVCEQSGNFTREQWLPLVDTLFNCNYLSPVWNKFISRQLLHQYTLFFSESMHLMEDCLFSLQCLEHCGEIYLLPEALYRYRQAEDEGNAARRLSRIPSLVGYMDHFSVLLPEWKHLSNSIYYMLLHQKIRSSAEKEIAGIAEDHRHGSFAPQTRQDQWLDEQLRAGHYRSLYLRSLKSRIRHGIAVFAKSHGLYKK